MSDIPDDDPQNLSVGDYVYDPPYLEMRLRMLLTNAAGPDDKVWASALQELLHFLDHTPSGQAFVKNTKRKIL